MKKKICLVAVLAFLLLATELYIFKADNTQISTVQATPIRVACVGDSITEKSGYTAFLEEMLGDNYSVGNFGVTGSTVSLSSFKPYMTQPEFRDALDFHPDIVVIMLGTNDAHFDFEETNESFVADYNKLVDSFQDLDSTPEVLIVKSPPIYNNSLGISSSYFSQNVIPSIDKVANYENVPTIDVYNAFGDHSEYMIDGIHPNDDGALLIASEVSNAITSQNNPSFPSVSVPDI